MNQTRCLIVKPIKDLQLVKAFLIAKGISYNWDEGIIFANLGEIPEGLEDIAVVTDPVFERCGQWYFTCEGDEAGPFLTEFASRVSFVQYISWSGEFVANSGDVTLCRKNLDELEELRKMGDADTSKKQRERLFYLSALQNKELRRQWGPLWDWLTFILWKFDIEGLCLPGHASYDEYEPEVKRILPMLQKVLYKRQDVAEILKEVFDEMFGKGHDIDRFDAIAKEITDFLNGGHFAYQFKDVKQFFC